MRQLLLVTFILLLVFQNAIGLNFKQISYIPKGQDGSYGFIRAFDTNHNGMPEIIFFTYGGVGNSYVIDYEYRPINQYVIADTLVPYGKGFFWNVGYIDNDSLCDIVVERGDTIYVYESLTYNSYPDSLVWKGKFSGVGIADSYITDMDNDGNDEILTSDHGAESVYVFENTTDNQYDLIFTGNLLAYPQVQEISAFAFDDFDGDSFVEFVTGSGTGHAVLWECLGDNQYQVIWLDTLETNNAYDVVSANAMDGDAKPEFIIGGFHADASFDWTGLFTFYEATGNDTYEIIYVDSVINVETWPNWHSASYCGDVDADGIPEAVLAVADNWFIYKATGNNTFQRIFQAYSTIAGSDNGRANTSICIYDMNQNGYKEIIESGSFSSIASETKIWEIEAVRILYPNGGEVFQPATQETIRWRKFTPPGADSFELLISYNNGLDYQTITTIGQSDESTYVWSVPDTSSDSCLVAIKAFGPGIGWDESDSVFKISPEGIGEMQDARCRIQDIRLYQNTPNPFSRITNIRYQIPDVGQGFSLANSKPEGLPYISLKIYNSAGQLVKQFSHLSNSPFNQIVWDATDNAGVPVGSGVYFCVLEITPHPCPPPQVGRDKGRGEINDYRAIKKMVLLR